jgi:ABC-2 type transport system ATP-binding protein
VARLDQRTLVICPADPVAVAIALPPGVTLTLRPDGALAFGWRRSETGAQAVLDAVRAAGIRVADVATEQPDLEDVFLALTAATRAA